MLLIKYHSTMLNNGSKKSIDMLAKMSINSLLVTNATWFLKKLLIIPLLRNSLKVLVFLSSKLLPKIVPMSKRLSLLWLEKSIKEWLFLLLCLVEKKTLISLLPLSPTKKNVDANLFSIFFKKKKFN